MRGHGICQNLVMEHVGLVLFVMHSVYALLQALKTGKSDRSTATRIGKMPVLNDFQFFNVKRLTELYEKEHAAEQHRSLMAQKEAALKGQVSLVGWST